MEISIQVIGLMGGKKAKVFASMEMVMNTQDIGLTTSVTEKEQ